MYRNFYSVYPLFNIYTLYSKDKEMNTWIQGLDPSLWKLINRIFKVYDDKGRVIDTLVHMIDGYKKYKYIEYIYTDKELINIIPVFYISDVDDLDKDYFTTLINLLVLNKNIKDITGWLDTNNNIICFIDKETAMKFYKDFGFN